MEVPKDALLTGNWGTAQWELFAADSLPDDAICTAVACVAIVDLDNQRVAMTRNTRSKESWEMPAGHVEANESPWDTLQREAHEEAGFVVDAARMFAYCKIVRPAHLDPRLLTERERSYPSPSYMPYYYAFTRQQRVPITGQEITETKDFTISELQHLAERGGIQQDELTILKLGLTAALKARKS